MSVEQPSQLLPEKYMTVWSYMENGSDGLFGKQPLSATSALTIVGESQSSWRTTPVICSFIRLADILVPQLKLAIYVMRSFTKLPSTMSPLWVAYIS
jgi:hypothetical protein